MTSKEVNAHNVAKGGGPRSAAGKRRASHNSYRHGLAASLSSEPEQARRVEKLARKIARDTADQLILEYAREAAQAQLDLEQVRRVKAATINQHLALPRSDVFRSSGKESTVMLRALIGGEPTKVPPAEGAAPALPFEAPERTAEAISRALPELIKLDRYEQNAVIRREQAMRAIHARCTFCV